MAEKVRKEEETLAYTLYTCTLLYTLIVFQLYNVNSSGDPEESIYGIMFEKFPATPKSDRKYFIMVSTLRYRNLDLDTFFTCNWKQNFMLPNLQ